MKYHVPRLFKIGCVGDQLGWRCRILDLFSETLRWHSALGLPHALFLFISWLGVACHKATWYMGFSKQAHLKISSTVLLEYHIFGQTCRVHMHTCNQNLTVDRTCLTYIDIPCNYGFPNSFICQVTTMDSFFQWTICLSLAGMERYWFKKVWTRVFHNFEVEVS